MRKKGATIFLPQAYKRLKRGPQVMVPKDIGMVIAYTGIGKDSVCVDAGAGSGWLAVSLARVCKKVTSYETRREFAKIARYNQVSEGLDNLVIKNRSIASGITEKDVDLVTLDMPDSEKIVRLAHRALKQNGYIFGYLPHVEQVKKFVDKLNKFKFINILVLEAIVRDILVREQGTRPSTKGVWHTGYLVFAQKQ